jgi:4-carboxymuconolactone decarboxylase
LRRSAERSPRRSREREKHDELVPGHVSALAATDPELIGAFDDSAFNNVTRHEDPNARTRLMAHLAAIDKRPGKRTAH